MEWKYKVETKVGADQGPIFLWSIVLAYVRVGSIALIK